MTPLSKGFHFLLFASASAGAMALLALAILINFDVWIRFLIGRPITGLFEIACLILVAKTFLPLGYMQYNKLHIRVDIISTHARGRWAAALNLLDAVAGLILFGLLLWAGTTEFLKAYSGGYLLPGLIKIPTILPLGFILIGTSVILITLVHLLVVSISELVAPHSIANANLGSIKSDN